MIRSEILFDLEKKIRNQKFTAKTTREKLAKYAIKINVAPTLDVGG